VKTLHLAEGLVLPAEAITQTFAILAMRGVGKTYTASVMAEEFSEAGLPYCVLDPTGAWWGLRASRTGKGPGYPVTILGGDHGDVPLEETGGKLVADLLAEEAPTLILDVSRFSKSATRRFVADFAERLYQKNRNPLHLFLDEADAFCPQKPHGPENLRMLGAIEEIVRRGRIRGLGCTLVTQRSAVLNKDVLTQAEVLVALRTAHPRDREPVIEWMESHATKRQIEGVERDLASLAKGEAFVMSAGWLDLFKRVQIRRRRTFNSSATPKPGERHVEPRRLAPVDLKKLEARMAATIERQKAEDPRALRAEVARLKAALAKAEQMAPKPAPTPPPVLRPADVTRLERLVERMLKAQDRLAQAQQAVVSEAGNFRGVLRGVLIRGKGAPTPPPPPKPSPPRPTIAALFPPSPSNGALPVPPRALRVLAAIAERHPEVLSEATIRTLTGYRPGGGFNNILGTLRTAGLLRGFAITEAGLAAVPPEALQKRTGEGLRNLWRGRLQPREWKVLEAVLARGPGAVVTPEELATLTGYAAGTGGFNNILGKLRSAALLEGRGEMRAAEALF
jgi:hypothetical protein